MIYKFSTALRNAIGQQIIDALDAGSGPAKINFRTQSLGVWAAGKAYAVGDSVFAAGRNYDCTTAGTSGGSAPIWPANGTVNDGTAVWTEGGDAGADILLGTLNCSDPSADVSGGVVTFFDITQDSEADASGRARCAVLTDSGDNAMVYLDVTHNAGTGAVKLNTTMIIQGGPILMSSLSITVGGA